MGTRHRENESVQELHTLGKAITHFESRHLGLTTPEDLCSAAAAVCAKCLAKIVKRN